MSIRLLDQVRQSIARISPGEISQAAERPVRILVNAASPAAYAAIGRFLVPEDVSEERRQQISTRVTRASDPASAEGRFHLIFHEAGLPLPAGWDVGKDLFLFDPARPGALVGQVLDAREDVGLSLARLFTPFRHTLASRTIHSISSENALFALVSALPNIVPSFAELPWAVGEFASDTAVLTTNQIRMAFLLAAASDRAVGFKQQRSEIGSIIAGAWGWRALARELVGKIPFGGGIIPKAAIAYAGTYVVGLSIERIYRVGYGLTRAERDEAYAAALARGKQVAAGLFSKHRPSSEPTS